MGAPESAGDGRRLSPTAGFANADDARERDALPGVDLRRGAGRLIDEGKT
jgi:hypothetical protein